MQGLPAGDHLHQDGQRKEHTGKPGFGILRPRRRTEHLRHDHRRGGAGPGTGVRGQGHADRVHQSLCNLSGSRQIQEEEMKGAEP